MLDRLDGFRERGLGRLDAGPRQHGPGIRSSCRRTLERGRERHDEEGSEEDHDENERHEAALAMVVLSRPETSHESCRNQSVCSSTMKRV